MSKIYNNNNRRKKYGKWKISEIENCKKEIKLPKYGRLPKK